MSSPRNMRAFSEYDINGLRKRVRPALDSVSSQGVYSGMCLETCTRVFRGFTDN